MKIQIEKKDAVKILIPPNGYFNFCVKKRVYEGLAGVDGRTDGWRMDRQCHCLAGAQ